MPIRFHHDDMTPLTCEQNSQRLVTISIYYYDEQRGEERECEEQGERGDKGKMAMTEMETEATSKMERETKTENTEGQRERRRPRGQNG